MPRRSRPAGGRAGIKHKPPYHGARTTGDDVSVEIHIRPSNRTCRRSQEQSAEQEDVRQERERRHFSSLPRSTGCPQVDRMCDRSTRRGRLPCGRDQERHAREGQWIFQWIRDLAGPPHRHRSTRSSSGVDSGGSTSSSCRSHDCRTRGSLARRAQHAGDSWAASPEPRGRQPPSVTWPGALPARHMDARPGGGRFSLHRDSRSSISSRRTDRPVSTHDS